MNYSLYWKFGKKIHPSVKESREKRFQIIDFYFFLFALGTTMSSLFVFWKGSYIKENMSYVHDKKTHTDQGSHKEMQK